MTITEALAWLRGLDERYSEAAWSSIEDANMLLGARVRNVLPQLIGIVSNAHALADVLGDRVHDGLKANEDYHWANLKLALTALAAAVKKERRG